MGRTFESGIGARGTSIDLRVSQTPMFLFICYIIISVMLIWIIVNNYYENKKTSYIMCLVLSLIMECYMLMREEIL